MNKNCLNCGAEFVAVQKTQKFCSRKCKDYWRHHHIIKKECKWCGKVFDGNNNTDYCCKECRDSGWVINLKKGMLLNHGYDNPLKSPEIKEKVKQTCLKRMGVSNPSLSPEVQEKRKQTMLKRFNSTSSFGDKEVQEKVKKSMIKNWGKPYPAQVPSILAKQNETSRKKHGGLHLFQTEEFKQETIRKNMQRDGVPYHCMTDRCKKASKKCSKTNKKFAQFLEENGFSVTRFDMPLGEYEYDIQLGNTLIELNPFAYHNMTYHPKNELVSQMCIRREELKTKTKDKTITEEEKEEKKKISEWRNSEINYAKNKIIYGRNAGYRCITVFDWDNKEKIAYLLDNNKIHIHARKCEVKQIEYNDCHQFFEGYHLQGDTTKNKNNIYIGLYYNDELIECMSFGKPRYNNKYEREILRLCSHKDYSVVGGASKIFNRFIKLVSPNSVVSYCDMSKFDGKVYEQLGFKLLVWNSPSLHWQSKTKQKEPPFPKHLTDAIVREKGFDKLVGKYFNKSYGIGTNNSELMRQYGYVEVYDCGQATYVRQKEKGEN